MRYITQILPLKNFVLMMLLYLYDWGAFFWDRFKSTKEKRFCFLENIHFLFLYHTFFHSVYNNNKNQKKTSYISDYVLRGIWGFLIFFCWKKLFTFSPCIFHTMYKTNFFILIHSLGTFSLCGVVCLSKKEGILRKCKLQKSGGLFFFQKLKLFFNKGNFFYKQKNFFSKRYFA